MANNLLPKAYGIDYPIQLLQTWLYEKLYVILGNSGLTSSKFQMFGRVYRNSDKEGGYVPEAFVSGVDYSKSLFHNDKLSLLMWFGLNDPTGVKGAAHTYNVTLYVFCNLKDVAPNNPNQRIDEYIVDTVRNLILPNRFGFYVKQVDRDIDTVLKRYSGSAKQQAVLDNNMQPKLCFAIQMTNTIDAQAYQDCSLPPSTPQYFNAMTGWITVLFKDTPDPTKTQTLVNGVRIRLEYPTGTTLTIPHLIGRQVSPNIQMDGNAFTTVPESVNYMQYNATTGTFSFNTFSDGSVMIIQYNENN